jgi:hypothetical protein
LAEWFGCNTNQALLEELKRIGFSMETTQPAVDSAEKE